MGYKKDIFIMSFNTFNKSSIKIKIKIKGMTIMNLNFLTKEGNEMEIEFLRVKKSSLILRALNNTLRQKILKLLEEQEKLTVSEIYIQLKLEQSVASQHLAILRRADIVKTVRAGKFIYYLLNNKRIEEIQYFIMTLLKY